MQVDTFLLNSVGCQFNVTYLLPAFSEIAVPGAYQPYAGIDIMAVVGVSFSTWAHLTVKSTNVAISGVQSFLRLHNTALRAVCSFSTASRLSYSVCHDPAGCRS